jgi:hypothetical protein
VKPLQQLIGLAELPLTFLETGAGPDPAELVSKLPGREVDVEPLVNVIEEAMRRFPQGERISSDAWLAPRVHHALRLSRREAARRGLWTWLSVVAVPHYVHWRFPGAKGVTPADRYLGREDKNAVGRLWWGGELMRNGDDYTPATVGFQMQDVPNTWMRLHAFHNRAFVQAALDVLATYNDGEPASSDQSNALSKAVNTAVRTVLLDSLAPDPPPDPVALEAWLAGAKDIDETRLFDEDPEGPPEDTVPEASVEALRKFLQEVAAKVPLDVTTKDIVSEDPAAATV